MQVEAIREPLLLPLTACHGDRFHGGEFDRFHHPKTSDLSERWQLGNLTYIYEMPVLRLAELIDPESARDNLSNTHSDPESL